MQVDRDSRSRRSSLHRALRAIFVPRSARLSSRRIGLAVLFAILCGVGSYFLVISIFNVPSRNFLSAPATAEQSGQLSSLPENGQATAPPPHAHPPHAHPRHAPPADGPGSGVDHCGGDNCPDQGNNHGPTYREAPVAAPQPCYTLTIPNSHPEVGQATEIDLVIKGCSGSSAANIFADVRSESDGITISGPVSHVVSNDSETWTWSATASTAGNHDIIVSVSTGGANTPIGQTITAYSKAEQGVSKWLSSGSTLLKSVAGTLASLVTIITSVVAIAALRRAENNMEPKQANEPTKTGADLSAEEGDGGDPNSRASQ
jgi:hypothetical protein